jgi:hypothetical protein
LKLEKFFTSHLKCPSFSHFLSILCYFA